MANTTQQHRDFAVQMVLTGGNGAEAARRAGFAADSAPQVTYRLMRLPHIQTARRIEQERVLRGHLTSKALYVLEQIMDNEDAPAGARVDTAKTVLDRAGLPALRQAGITVPGNPLVFRHIKLESGIFQTFLPDFARQSNKNQTSGVSLPLAKQEWPARPLSPRPSRTSSSGHLGRQRLIALQWRFPR